MGLVHDLYGYVRDTGGSAKDPANSVILYIWVQPAYLNISHRV